MKIRINNFTIGETSENSQKKLESGATYISGDMAVASSIKYETPLLVSYGDVRDVTLGPTAGVGESGCEFDRDAGTPLSCP